MASKDVQAIRAFEEHCNAIRQHTVTSSSETEAEKQRRIDHLLGNYGDFFSYYFPHYAKSPNGDFHVEEAHAILANPRIRAVEEWARGHAKSTHFDIGIPLWLKAQKVRQLNVMVLVGKSEDNADTLLADVQAELMSNQRYISDFGEQYSVGSWEDGEFVTRDGCAFFARGRGQSPRGLRHRETRPDYIVIDDLDDDDLVQNEERVRKLVDWVLEALFGAFDMGRGRFVMVGNRIGKNSVLARMAERPGLHHRVVNARDETGRPTWHQKYTEADLAEVEELQGYRRFQKEYMNNPITEGTVFKHNWIKYKPMLPLAAYDHLVVYCDPSFKSSSKSDYKAVKFWGKKGKELHHIKAFVRQATVTSMVQWFYDLHESLPDAVLVEFWMEANFMQDTLLDEFTTEGDKRGYQLPIRKDTRAKPDKFQRIEAVSPLWERGFVFYNEALEKDPDQIKGIEQTLAIGKGSRVNDDGPDADEGAIWLLQRKGRADSFGSAVIGKRVRKGR